MDDAERGRIGRELGDYFDHMGSENTTLDAAHRHKAAESDRHAADASQKEMELCTLRGVVGRRKGEAADMADAALRLCDLLVVRSMSADEAEAVTALRTAMKEQQARQLVSMLRDSVRKFAALSIIARIVHKLRVSNDVREAAEKWARKQLQL